MAIKKDKLKKEVLKIVEEKNKDFNSNNNKDTSNIDKNNTDNNKTKNKGGRPKKIIDYDQVYKYAKIFATQEEVASVMGFERRMFADNEKLSHIYKKGLNDANTSLRRMQFIMAETNPTMAIWLGKQYLGQRDKHDIDANQTIKRIEIINDLPKENKKE